MKRKTTPWIIIGLLLVVLCLAAAYYLMNTNKPVEVQEPTTAQQTTEPTTKYIDTLNPTLSDEVDTSIVEETSSKISEKIYGKYWYLFNEDEKICYVFKFDKNNRNVDLAYFNSENMEGLDAQYTKGYSIYTINGNNIVLKNLPDAFPIKSFTLTINGDKIYNGDTELIEYSELSLDNALEHFE